MAHVLYSVLLLSSYVGFTLVMQDWAPAHCVLHVSDCWSSKARQGNTWTAAGRRFPCGFPACQPQRPGDSCCAGISPAQPIVPAKDRKKNILYSKNPIYFYACGVQNKL